ncbi:DUF397 domain-containing protein [Streptomyces sp. NPDC055210]
MIEESARITWQKSSYSSNQADGTCCEVALLATATWVRDSKIADGAVLRFSLPAWQVAVAYFGGESTSGGVHEQG